MANENSKSFWKKPEGVPGMIVLAGLVGVGGYFLYNALPAIIKLLENTLYAGILAGALVGIITLIMNDKFRSTVWYLYKGLMRWFTGMVIELNPIAILESYVEDIKKKIVKMEAQLTDLRGQIGKINRKLDDRRKEQKLEVDRALQAQKMGKIEETKLHARQAERLQAYIDKLDALSKKMEIIFKVLDKMKYYSEIMVKDTEMDVEIRKEEREAITKSHSVMKSAMNIIKGNDDKKMIFDQAMEYVVDDIGFKVGEMDRMLEASTDFINSVDLDNAVYEERGMKMLEEFEKKGMDTIFGAKDKKGAPALATGTIYQNLQNFSTPTPVSNNGNSGEKKKYFDQ